ncbi:nitronate monooxygenase [Amycolatopsis sp. NPDC005961]|uniref:NAD(P)H-dependent flavin oxidoreductase n=1 Tax=Amycolatopsis sp. NPDC005961 TaxID=3156720 RepID=UPI0033DE2EC2
MFDELTFPVIAAPMAGGPTTPELVAAVSEAGGFGFLSAGMLTPAALAAQIDRTRELTGREFGVNLFVPQPDTGADVSAHQERLQAFAREYDVELGEPKWDDDAYPAKLDVVLEKRVPVVSFTFGPPSDVVRLREAGSTVVVTVTTPEAARRAADLGADALVLQGFEAGGHRSLFTDDARLPGGGAEYGVLALLRLVAAHVDLPLVAAGGLVHGADVAAVLAAGAVAAQLGTVFLRADEAGTSEAHRKALALAERETAFTRAFSGRPARGLVNRFMDALSEGAPAAYPQLNSLAGPVRKAAAKAGDPEAISLWAGQTYPLAYDASAAVILERLKVEARDAAARLDRIR